MNRCYFYARAVGRPEDVLNRIIRVVSNSGVASQVPLVKLERKARGEFYVFLGVDCEDNYRFPDELGDSLRSVDIRFEEAVPLEPAQIASMVQRQDVEIHAFNALKYRPLEDEELGDPFEQPSDRVAQEVSDQSSVHFEHMLHWLSAQGEGSWQTFKNACEVLGLANGRLEVRSILRRFVLLGHVDLSSDGSRWSIATGAFVRFPDAPSFGFLAGQRTETSLRSIGEHWPLSRTTQPQHSGPPRMDLGSGVMLRADEFATVGVVDAGIASTELSHVLPDIDGWKASLESVPGLNTGAYTIEKWKFDGFETDDALYDREEAYFGESGLYRLSRDNERLSHTLFFDEPAQRWLKGDWYGLRFLAIRATGHSAVEAFYDSSTADLFIPVGQRWPLLYERALALTSGLLPRQAVNPNWLIYPRVPPNLAQVLSGKLDVTLREE